LQIRRVFSFFFGLLKALAELHSSSGGKEDQFKWSLSLDAVCFHESFNQNAHTIATCSYETALSQQHGVAAVVTVARC
jgi:hypothetical protein